MPRPGRLPEIAAEHGEPLDTLIPRKLNEHGTIEKAAHDLGISFKTLYEWVKANGVEKQIKWVKEEPEHA